MEPLGGDLRRCEQAALIDGLLCNHVVGLKCIVRIAHRDGWLEPGCACDVEVV